MADRRLTAMRERLVRRRTQTLNQIHKILRRQNLEWERPTKTFQTRKVAAVVEDPATGADGSSGLLNQLLVQWQLWEEQIVKVRRADCPTLPREPGRPAAGYDPRREHVSSPWRSPAESRRLNGFRMVGAWRISWV